MNIRCRHISILFILSFVLSGCAVINSYEKDYYVETTGGIALNMFPAPKNLIGKVNGDIYYSAENVFSVKLPHPPSKSNDDRYEWSYTNIREIKDQGVIGVVFGPAAFDKNLYHSVLVRAPMKDDKEEYAKNVFNNKLKSRSGDYTERHYKLFQLNGKDCYYIVYESNNYFLILSIVDNEKSFHVVEADILKSDFAEKVSLETLVNREYSRFNELLSSFKVIDDSYKKSK